MKSNFKKFNANIKLTTSQREDATTKYSGVISKMNSSYYDNANASNNQFLFGSHKTGTNTRPLAIDQDVDVLFKIPQDVFDRFDDYEGNGQSALLQEVRNYLNEKYTTTDEVKGWGKVVLVKFADNTHNVELLPALELEDGTFLIPNSENGGSWDPFDPRTQVEEFQESNSETNGLTADLCRMLKTWVKTTASLNYKSFDLLGNVMEFLENEFEEGANYMEYPEVVKNFLEHLQDVCDDDIESHVETAYNRAVKAIEFMDNDKLVEASEEWKKIFGDEFPKTTQNPKKEEKAFSREIVNPAAPWRR